MVLAIQSLVIACLYAVGWLMVPIIHEIYWEQSVAGDMAFVRTVGAIAVFVLAVAISAAVVIFDAALEHKIRRA